MVSAWIGRGFAVGSRWVGRGLAVGWEWVGRGLLGSLAFSVLNLWQAHGQPTAIPQPTHDAPTLLEIIGFIF